MNVHIPLVATLLAILALHAGVQVQPFPADFHTQEIVAGDATIHVRVGGKGPAVVLLHGYGETGDMWTPLAVDLARDHTVIVPDLRGLGLSSKPASGYDKKTQARDVATVLDTLKVERADLVTHDIGNMVGYAFAAQYPARVTRFVIMDAPVPGIGLWEEILKNPLLWHFRFGGPDMERLVAGRERIYLDRFWNEFSAKPERFTEASREHYAELYAMPGAMHAGFAQFAAFDQDAIDNKAFLAKGKLTMPVLAIGGEKSFGPTMATVMRATATDVHEGVVPDAGHWLMEEQPAATVKMIRAFLDGKASIAAEAAAQRATPILAEWRLTPEEAAQLPITGAGPGTSGVQGIETRVLAGDPTKPGPYTISIRVPPNTRIDAHTHRDHRSAVVIAGVWYFGFGDKADDAKARALQPGSYYLEPADVAHFAHTGAEGATVYITGVGPSDTRYVADLRK
jgi:pimeloyl-ACP methyl ester carboxylesterase/quercetin dioxygenase-like cupin family protein